MSQNKKESTKAYKLLKDAHGREKVQGIWDNGGKKTPVTFSRNYGSHRFDDAEIQALLKNETVNVDNFKPKASDGEILDVTGKLGYQYYMGKMFVGFSITDINKEAARRIPDVAEHPMDAENEMDY